jgi:tetratricopeptide (TPR) repeat protein
VEAPDILAEFQQLIASVPTEVGAGSTELLLQGFGSAEAQLLRRCAIPHQFSVPLLGVLSPDSSEQELRNYYEEFTQLPIITPSADILMMHDQSRTYLFRQWLDPERQTEFAAISGRLAEFFKTKGDQALLPNDKESFQRRRMFHLIGFDQDSGVAEFERLSREKRRQLRLTECESLIKLVHEYDDVLAPQNRVRLIYHEGKLATDRRDLARAKALFETIAENSSTLPEYRIKALNRLGMVHAELRQFPTAIAYYQRAQDLATAQRYPEVFRTLLELGSAHRDSGNLRKAEELLDEGVALAKKAQSFFSVAVGYNSLGMLHRRLNDIPRAIRDYEQSLENLDRAGEKFRRGQVLSELGTAYTERRDWTTAEKYFLQSLEIERQAGDKHNQAIVQNNLARVYQNRNQPKEALEAAREAVRLFNETRDFYRAATATRNLGKLLRATKDRAGCEQAFRDAIEQFRRCNEINAAEDTERELAALLRKVGLPWWAWLLIVLLILLLTSSLVYFALLAFGVIK